MSHDDMRNILAERLKNYASRIKWIRVQERQEFQREHLKTIYDVDVLTKDEQYWFMASFIKTVPEHTQRCLESAAVGFRVKLNAAYKKETEMT